MDYKQALEFIDSYTDYEKTPVPHAAANYDLRRLEELLAHFDNPQFKIRAVHITGTKGKGSTAAMVASVLEAAGYRTGLYTSPHLLTMRERIRINDTLISEGEFVSVFERLEPAIRVVNERANYGKITTFELLTAMAFIYFTEKKTDFQVLEVGMGGTYDATNVIKSPEVCIITSISYDHIEVLGNTLTEIANEKCGIIKPECVVVSAPQVAEAADVIRHICSKRGAQLIEVGNAVSWRGVDFDINSQQFVVGGRLANYNLSIPLLGDHQLVNAATAVAAIEVMRERGFKIDEDSIAIGLSGINWPGRFQIIGRNPLVVLDGAHNTDSAQKLIHTIVHYTRFEKIVLVIGISADKDIAGIISSLAPVIGVAVITRSRNPRAMSPGRIAAELDRINIKTVITEDVPEALTRAVALAGPSGMVCVTGSLFIVAEALEIADQFTRC